MVAEFIFATKVQVASWHLGVTRLAVTAIRPGLDQASLVVGGSRLSERHVIIARAE